MIQFAEAEIDKDTEYLSKDRGKAATLLQGAVERSDLSRPLDLVFESLIAQNIGLIEAEAREIRKAEVGDEAAIEEERCGRKTDDEYAYEAAKRQAQRAKARKQEEAKKRREQEKAELKAMEARKMKELEKLRNAEERRKERAAARAAKVASEMDRKEHTDPLVDGVKLEKDQRVIDPPENQDASSTPAAKTINERKIEEEALALLIEEGRALASKNEKKEQEPIESREPPHRIAMEIPKGPAADRFKVAHKPEFPTSKLSYSSTSVRHHSNSGSPLTPAAFRNRSRSPHRRSSVFYEHSRARPRLDLSLSASSYPDHGVDEGEFRSGETDMKATAKRDVDADECERSKADIDEGGYRNSTQRRDSDVSRYNEYDYSRDHRHRYEEPAKHRDEHYNDRTSSRYDSRGTKYERRSSTKEVYEDDRPRPRTDEPPEHIDRYVPGGGSAREEGNDKNRDRDVTRERDAAREHRDRSSYHDRDCTKGRDYFEKERPRERDRDRDYHDRDRHRSKYGDTKYRERGYGKERDEAKYRDREPSTYERSRTKGNYENPRPRRDPAPENIDRYVPS